MKVKVLVLLLLFSHNSFAKTVARVLEMNGNAFVFFGKDKSKALSYGDKIEELSEVMVDDEGSLSLKDESGTVYHLAGGSYIKILNNQVEVKNGNVWVSSKSSQNFGVISSVNGIVKYSQGQFVYSFDNLSGKSQVLVLTGDVTFSNVVEPGLSIPVVAGHFSFVDQELANGLPRGATRVGLSSYQGVKSLFQDVKGIEQATFDKAILGESAPASARSIASVSSSESVSGKKGKIVFIETHSARTPASVDSKEISVHDYYKSLKAKKVQTKSAVVKMYGFDDIKVVPSVTKSVKVESQKPVAIKVVEPKVASKVEEKEATLLISEIERPVERTPASVEKVQLIEEINTSGSFEKSLNKANQVNKRHPEEVNQLIDELKSYNQTFQKNY